MSYSIYLRKSRADLEAESRGEGETLARHEKELLSLAKKLRLNITAIYREIVSGETISARPKMQQLLREVEEGMWEGVLVMEVERLARGDTKDQGTVSEAFKFSNTKIITPSKVYDPSNEFDEEYFEFGLFMSRREYKTINRRIQRGRIASVNEGKYIAGTAPYGYRKVKIKAGKGYTLEVVPEEASVIKTIFHLYTTGELQDDGTNRQLGMYLICKYLDEAGIKPPKNDTWSRATINDILRNPTYIGMVRWQWRKVIKQISDGIITESRTKDSNCMIIKGLHEPIISTEVFEMAQNIRKNKAHISVKSDNTLLNPLSGIMYCAKCGHSMTRASSNTKTNYPVLKCPNRKCDNISSPLGLVEKKLIASLEDWLAEYELKWGSDIKEHKTKNTISTLKAASIKKLSDKRLLTQKQLNNTYDLLEQGIYSAETFTSRNQALASQIESIDTELKRLRNEYENDLARERAKFEYIPSIRHMLDIYYSLDDAYTKNTMLRNVIDHVSYLKTERNVRGNKNNANFELTLFPRIPDGQ